MGHAHDVQVLVVGAGPVGLALSVELARHGISCRTVDQAPEPTTTSKALAVHSRTLELFAAMGLSERALEAGHRAYGLSVFAEGQRIAHLELDNPDTRYQFALMLPQSETERLLTERLAELGGRVERPVRLETLEQDAGGVTATLRHLEGDEQSGETETVRASFVVGCDGSRSTVRKILGLEFTGSTYEEAWVAADVRVDWALPHDEIYLFFSESALFAAFPLPGDRYRLLTELGEAPAEGRLPAPTFAEFQGLWEQRGPGHGALSDPAWIGAFRIHRRRVDRYGAGRVFVAGDAAHIHSPAGGQGMNTGIQDSCNLAWKLALVLKGHADVSLLSSYQAEREPVAEHVLQMSDRMTRIGTLRHPIAQKLRNRLLPIISGLDVLEQRFARQMSELDIHYRSSPAVGERWRALTAVVRAGDRAPDLRVPPNGSLFDPLFSTGHLLLLFGGEGSSSDLALLRAAWERFAASGLPGRTLLVTRTWAEWSGDQVTDPEGLFHAAYGAPAPCLFLVRPDGYVAFRALPPDPDALADYLARLYRRPSAP